MKHGGFRGNFYPKVYEMMERNLETDGVQDGRSL